MSFGSLLQQPSSIHHHQHPTQLLPAFQPYDLSQQQQQQQSAQSTVTGTPNPSSTVPNGFSDSPRTPVQRNFSDPTAISSRKGRPMTGDFDGVAGKPFNGPGQLVYASPLPSRPTPAETLLRRKTPGGGMVIGGFDAAPPMNFGIGGVMQLGGGAAGGNNSPGLGSSTDSGADLIPDGVLGRPRKHILLVGSGNSTPIDLDGPLTPTNTMMPSGGSGGGGVGTPSHNMQLFGAYMQGQQQPQQQSSIPNAAAALAGTGGFQTPIGGHQPTRQINDLSRIPAASASANANSLSGHFAGLAGINTNVATPTGLFQHESPLDDMSTGFPSRSNNATPVPLDFQRRPGGLTPTIAGFQGNPFAPPPSLPVGQQQQQPQPQTQQQFGAIPIPTPIPLSMAAANPQLQHLQHFNLQQIQQQQQLTLSYPQLGALVQDGGPMPAVLGFNSPARMWSPYPTPSLDGMSLPQFAGQYVPPYSAYANPNLLPNVVVPPLAPAGLAQRHQQMQLQMQMQQLQGYQSPVLPIHSGGSVHLPQQVAFATAAAASSHSTPSGTPGVTPGNPFTGPASPAQKEATRECMLIWCNDAYVDLLSFKQQSVAGKGVRIHGMPRHVGLSSKSFSGASGGAWRTNGAGGNGGNVTGAAMAAARMMSTRPDLQRCFSDPVAMRAAAAAAVAAVTAAGGTATPQSVGGGVVGVTRTFDAGMHGDAVAESVTSASKRRRLNSLQDDGRIAAHFAGRPAMPGMPLRSASTTNLAGMGGQHPQQQWLGMPGTGDLLPSSPSQLQPNRRFGMQHRASSLTGLDSLGRKRLSDVRILKAGDPPSYKPSYDSALSASPTTISSPMSLHSFTPGAVTTTPLIPAPIRVANGALELLEKECAEGNWTWLEGMLLAGCLSYALGDIKKARDRYKQILDQDPSYVEALTNMGSTSMSMGNKAEAETLWIRAIKLRPGYFEALEHLISVLAQEKRGAEAVSWIDYVESSLRRGGTRSILDRSPKNANGTGVSGTAEWDCGVDAMSVSTDESSGVAGSSMAGSTSDPDDADAMEGDYFSAKKVRNGNGHRPSTASTTSSNPAVPTVKGGPLYIIPPVENGRLLQLIHAKGNMLYSTGQNLLAAKAFEDAVLLAMSMSHEEGIEGLIKRILDVLSTAIEEAIGMPGSGVVRNSSDPLLLSPDRALRTSRLLFPPHGELPGLKHVAAGPARKTAISTTSNSLLSLAKIYQDAISAGKEVGKAAASVRNILALYYLSLSLHPSPSTANNVGILLASVQQASPLSVVYPQGNPVPPIPGLIPGSGVALALGYYYYGLQLDNRHAHLYTNLGSLLKDMGQLPAAIKMYEQAVDCDGRFDIALANLANAVKDQGGVAEAIKYYKRAVSVNPDFAEAVCGLANALNSVCDWFGRGGVGGMNSPSVAGAGGEVVRAGRRTVDRWHVGGDGLLVDAKISSGGGWMRKVVEIVERQLGEGREWGKGILSPPVVEALLADVQRADGKAWSEGRKSRFRAMLERWKGQCWQGAKLVQLVERIAKKLVWRWYQDVYVLGVTKQPEDYRRPLIPGALSVPNAPTVLPFHTFTCPLTASQVRMISQRNGLRISCSTLKSPWLSPLVSPPPRPPAPCLNVGYISSDFSNHPLAHLMQSVFGFHDPNRVKAFCYATSPNDGSAHRIKIEREAPVFRDVSTWGVEKLVKQIQEDGIHILVNLNGFTRGARNEVFAAKPAPLQMSFMGFAGTLGAEWCDYIYADETAVPKSMLRPRARVASFADTEATGPDGEEDVEEWDGDDYEEGEWVYAENVIYSKSTFFCTDHKQSAPDHKVGRLDWTAEQDRRWKMRKMLFPDLGNDKVILGNFNQLYKIEPTTFRTWLRILSKVPNAILWLLRFPDLGEANLLRFAKLWAGEEVASRIIFTDVAAKDQHISRARVCDLFLDTPECNAHTTAADVLWSGSPLLTFPRHEYKMCSRIAGSIVRSAVPDTEEGKKVSERLVVDSEEMYEARAVELAKTVAYDSQGRGSGELVEMRQVLVESRWSSGLFDTLGWVKSLEEGYWRAWEMWARGERGDVEL